MNDFFNLIGDFFQNRPLSNEEQILLGFLAVLLFLFGYLIGWLIQRASTKRYKKELLVMKKDRDEYEVRYRTADTKQKALAKELEAVSREKVAALDTIQQLRTEVADRDRQLGELRSRNEELTATNQSYSGTIESLNDQVIGLKTQNEQLTAAGGGGTSETPEGAQGTAASPQQPTAGLPADVLNTFVAATEARFNLFAERLGAMAEDNARLRAELGRVGTSATTTPVTSPQPAPGTGNSYTGHQPVMNPGLSGNPAGGGGTPVGSEPLVIRADTTAPGVRTGHQGDTEVIVQTTPSLQVPVVGLGEGATADDLTLIDNIGPFLQKKLNEVDIYRFEQIAGWSDADITTYTELIEYIPGIIERDDWVGQARALSMSEAAYGAPISSEDSGGTEETPAPAPAEQEVVDVSALVERKGDDLKIVEGIGPKIETILKASGILTLEELADADTDQLRSILDDAGSRFRSHDPKTWAVQAGLAADGKLDELKAWQKELKGGK